MRVSGVMERQGGDEGDDAPCSNRWNHDGCYQ
jgi:hypothetical protein